MFVPNINTNNILFIKGGDQFAILKLRLFFDTVLYFFENILQENHFFIAIIIKVFATNSPILTIRNS
ncbi:hypothetical protein B0A72_04300 [Flavobacterium pectinovorum]|uniref:Uncharacterized protein n=1 Tax=Flavobacterium pectinovorum TaxID=29533 RepID=A0AB36P4N4_9FLAO|nr:hypothetical protein B0A72_04300 [Flavobacterium pectinovorum]